MSPVFETLLHVPFKEAMVLRQHGKVDITLEEDAPQAVGLVLIAHHKALNVDTNLSLEMIANVAIVADRHDCMALLASHIKDWAPNPVNTTSETRELEGSFPN